MNRRKFLNSAATAGLAAGVHRSRRARQERHLRVAYFRMRNGNQIQRTSDFLSKSLMPAWQRAGAGPMGFFNAVIGEQSPFALALVSFPSLAAIGDVMGQNGSRQRIPESGR